MSSDFTRQMLEQLLLPHFSKSDVQERIHAYAHPYRELIAYYRCAMMHVETKFNILDEELSLEYDRNPIESIKTRLKSLESIVDKAIRKQVPLTVESIEQNLNDVAGVRVICSHSSRVPTARNSSASIDQQRRHTGQYIVFQEPVKDKPPSAVAV